jgi:SRSO17 transposase
LEEYAARFDDLFTHAAQRRGFRDYLAGLLLPRDRNKTVTALAGPAPIVEAQEAPVQRLQSFLWESVWDAEAINARHLELTWTDAESAPHEGGVLGIDETGDRKDGSQTAHVAHQYLGSVDTIANGIVSVTRLWADERVPSPLHVGPYTPAARFPLSQKDPTLRTTPQRAVGLVSRAQDLGVPFRAVVADCIYGESAASAGPVWAARQPSVLAVRPSRGTWGPQAGGGPTSGARRPSAERTGAARR